MRIDLVDFSYEADMGFTHRELERGLVTAVAPYTISKTSSLKFEFRHDNYLVVLDLKPEETRKIASIRLPITTIKLSFHGMPEEEYERFLHNFRRHLQRGGG